MFCSCPPPSQCPTAVHSLDPLPFPLSQAWAWGERVLDAGSLDRFTVDTVVTDQGVLSALLIDPTHDADFALPYNCTAWNRFGARSAAVSLRRQGEAPIFGQEAWGREGRPAALQMAGTMGVVVQWHLEAHVCIPPGSLDLNFCLSFNGGGIQLLFYTYYW